MTLWTKNAADAETSGYDREWLEYSSKTWCTFYFNFLSDIDITEGSDGQLLRQVEMAAQLADKALELIEERWGRQVTEDKG
jgi:hypothetical protein